jgi:hypothetical protein
MPAELAFEINGIAKAAQTSGFLLGNPAAKLHAIQALNCRPFVI